MQDIGPSRNSVASDRRALQRSSPVRQPAPAPQPTPEPMATQPSPRPKKQANAKKSFDLKWVIIGLVIVAALALGAWAWWSQKVASATIDSSKYQAVFLSNGQIYFGKLKVVNDKYLQLSNVFYIQSKSTDGSQNQQQTQSTNSNMQLIKLGDEVHGPEDAMTINRDQVQFFENLKSDGRVAQLINDYKTGNK